MKFKKHSLNRGLPRGYGLPAGYGHIFHPFADTRKVAGIKKIASTDDG